MKKTILIMIMVLPVVIVSLVFMIAGFVSRLPATATVTGLLFHNPAGISQGIIPNNAAGTNLIAAGQPEGGSGMVGSPRVGETIELPTMFTVFPSNASFVGVVVTINGQSPSQIPQVNVSVDGVIEFMSASTEEFLISLGGFIYIEVRGIRA